MACAMLCAASASAFDRIRPRRTAPTLRRRSSNDVSAAEQGAAAARADHSPLLLLALGVALAMTTSPSCVYGQFDGSACSLSSGSGICRPIDVCTPVLQALISGRRPEVLCGYDVATPIVCCPDSDVTSSSTRRPPSTTTTAMATRRPTTTRRRPTDATTNPLRNSRPARRMCAEYAKSVYALQPSPVLLSKPQLVNVSLCGITSMKLIIGGTLAEPREFPHMAAVGYKIDNEVRWSCGGTLISDLFVLTAAHCVYTQNGPAHQVLLGDLNLNTDKDDAKPQIRNVAQRINHPDHKPPIKYNDIGLLKMDRPVKFDAYVRPACLPLGRTSAGVNAVATGWGIQDFLDDEGSSDLLKVTLPVLSHEECQKQYKVMPDLPNGIDVNIQFCAGQLNKDTCQGDSGGPLVVFNKDEECMYNVIGITSFGAFCGAAPGVLTRVYGYLSWIEETVWGK